MKILYVIDGAYSVLHWSGTTMALCNALKEEVKVDILEVPLPQYINLGCRVYHKLAKGISFPERTELVRRYRERVVEQYLRGRDYDAIFCVGSVVAASIPSVKIPVYIYIDSVASIMKGYYWVGDLDQYTYRATERLELMGLNRSPETGGKIFTTCQWARQGCIRDYGISPEAVKFVGIGANSLTEYNKEHLDIKAERCANELGNGLKLLFVGVDWRRKGLSEVFDLVKILKYRGISVTLDVVGCHVDVPEEIKNEVRIYGRLNKGRECDRDQLMKLFEEAHFLVFPTHAECSAVVICESSSFGTPVMANATGGLDSLIQEGKNGFLMTLDMEKWADKLEYYTRHSEEYLALRRSSYMHYQKELNWKAVTIKIMAEMMEEKR